MIVDVNDTLKKNLICDLRVNNTNVSMKFKVNFIVIDKFTNINKCFGNGEHTVIYISKENLEDKRNHC